MIELSAQRSCSAFISACIGISLVNFINQLEDKFIFVSIVRCISIPINKPYSRVILFKVIIKIRSRLNDDLHFCFLLFCFLHFCFLDFCFLLFCFLQFCFLLNLLLFQMFDHNPCIIGSILELVLRYPLRFRRK